MADHARVNASAQLLVQSHVFGLNHEVSNNVTYLDEQTILYPAGSQLVLYNLEQKSQKFISINDGDGITTLQISAGQAFAAVAVKSNEKGPYVAIIDLLNPRKKKLLMLPEGNFAKEVISLSFTNDMRNIVAQTGAPDWSLYYWTWEKAKLLANVKSAINTNTEIHQMTCNPFDANNTLICVTGNLIFRIFKFTEGNFKLVNQQKPDKNLICHCWISEVRVIAGTEDSKLLVFDAGDLILEISYVFPGNVSMKTPSIQTVTQFSGGIMAGTSTGFCVLFEKTEDNFLYKKNKEFLLEENAVRCIAMNPTDDMAVCTLSNSQIYVVTLDADSNKGEEIKCDRLCQPFHHGNVVGMDTCARKPLIATCGTDKSIRIWNYIENTIEVIKFFDDEPLSIALHPSGLYVLVGFADCLKLMNVLIDDIRPYWESNIRGCRECRFSNGGQYFASVYGSTIGIHRTWSFETVGYLKGHAGKVKSICWSADDSRLVSCGLDGNVFDWNVTLLKKEGEFSSANALFTSACYASDLKTIYSVGSDGNIRVISESSLMQEVSGKIGYSAILTSRSGKHVFAATSKVMVELRMRVETLKAENDTQLKLKDMNYSEKLRDLMDKYTSEIEGLKQLTAVLTHDRKSNEEKHTSELGTAKVSNRTEIEDMEFSFKIKMAAESEKHSELISKVEQLKSSWERQMDDMESFHLSRVSQMTDYYKKKIQEKQDDNLQVRIFRI
ncbi:WD40-repeat-containing domain protein [Chytriomyces sp. MP71]|nr:WD40-repeat-containing domain protein [Chytriomyces sp. MP71]